MDHTRGETGIVVKKILSSMRVTSVPHQLFVASIQIHDVELGVVKEGAIVKGNSVRCTGVHLKPKGEVKVEFFAMVSTTYLREKRWKGKTNYHHHHQPNKIPTYFTLYQRQQ
jgi:hypothetical protein